MLDATLSQEANSAAYRLALLREQAPELYQQLCTAVNRLGGDLPAAPAPVREPEPFRYRHHRVPARAVPLLAAAGVTQGGVALVNAYEEREREAGCLQAIGGALLLHEDPELRAAGAALLAAGAAVEHWPTLALERAR